MRYLSVRWNHGFSDYPVLLLSEMDEHSREHRKVDVFRDGSMNAASTLLVSDTTFLSDEPLPSFEEIASDTQFEPDWITKGEFQAYWNAATAIPATVRVMD